MAAVTLSLRSFSARLKKKKDHGLPHYTVPEGVSPELAEKFIRAMKAESMREIEDVTNEEIVEMLEKVTPFSGIIDLSDFLSDSIMRKLESLSTPFNALGRRRVL